MKTTGIVRNVDELGRVVLPKELRNTLDIKADDPLEIWVDGSKVVLRKYQTGCIFCGEATENTFMEKQVCEKCRKRLAAHIEI